MSQDNSSNSHPHFTALGTSQINCFQNSTSNLFHSPPLLVILTSINPIIPNLAPLPIFHQVLSILI